MNGMNCCVWDYLVTTVDILADLFGQSAEDLLGSEVDEAKAPSSKLT